MTVYLNFELNVGSGGEGEYPVDVTSSPAGDASGTLRLDPTDGDLQAALHHLEVGETSANYLAEIGERLFTALFTGDVHTRYAESVGMVGIDDGLRLRLRLGPPELQALPWELLRDPEKRESLGLSRRTLVVRYLPVPRPSPPLVVEPPLRVLVAAASPTDRLPLDIDGELTAIEQAVQPLSDRVQVIPLTHCTKQSLRRHLMDNEPHVLHVVAHGDFDGQEGTLVLENERGRAERLPGTVLGMLLKGSNVRLAVLNTCLSATDTAAVRSDTRQRAAMLGVGPALVGAGLGAVVGMQFSLPDVSAVAFARDFYEMLARFEPVDVCVARAREALLLEAGRDSRDWAAPVLFLRSPDGRLFDIGEKRDKAPLTAPLSYDRSTVSDRAKLFISYKREAESDRSLAVYLHDALTARGHEVFIDLSMRTGDAWMEEIDRQIKASDFLVVLLSSRSADSEMVRAEVSRAYEYRELQGKPHTLPVRVAYEGLLPYSIAAFVNQFQYVVWQNEADNEQVAREILAAIAGRLPQGKPIPVSVTATEAIISEDGRPVADDRTPHAPLPAFDPRFLKELVVPGGAVRLRDRFYIERDADTRLKEQIVEWGTTSTIRAPRQTGKTSLLMRGIHHAREQGAKVVFLDFQSWGSSQLTSLDVFLQEFAQSICDELDLDEKVLEQAWAGTRSALKKLLRFMNAHVLPTSDSLIVLAMDEADCLLQTGFYKDFFGLLRSWHNRRARPGQELWEKLNIVLVISTEPYLLIDDIHQSPFNVGLDLDLADFDPDQVRDLNRRHGSPVSDDDLPQMMTLLRGHPFLTRQALYTMVTENLTWADLGRHATSDHGPFGDHLRHQYWTIRDKPQLKEALKEIVVSGRCSDDLALFRLLRAGLVRGSGDAFTCRCELYEHYFKDKLF